MMRSGDTSDTSGSAMSGSETFEATSSERMPMAGRDDADPASGGMGSDTSPTGQSPTGQSGAALSDAQVAAITELVNNSEIMQAQLAQSKSKNPRVLNYAAMMVSHHNQARQQQSALGLSTAASPTLESLSSDGQKTLATLTEKTGKAFDRAYLQAQIGQHQKVLDTLDAQLIPSAKAPELRTHLQSMKPTVQQHLQAARDALASLNPGTSTGASDSPRQ